MEDSYRLVLEKVLEYEQRQQRIICAFLVIAIIIVALVAAKQFRKTNYSNKVVVCAILIVLCAALPLYVLTCNTYQKAIMEDIANCTYVTYCGEYFHDNYQKDSFYHDVNCMVNDENSITLRYPDYGNHYSLFPDSASMPVGTSYGTIIYSKNSKIIVSWGVSN